VYKLGIKVIDIGSDTAGLFVSRENRFLGIVDIGTANDEEMVLVHIHDPGRLEEILYPGNKVLLRKASGNDDRKTSWDLLAGFVDSDWILVNSSFHRQISQWALERGILPFTHGYDSIRPETMLGKSRIDFLLEGDSGRMWVEVKGCTLLAGETALFPDAPTARGTRHLRELIDAVETGDRAALIILVFAPGAREFSPNAQMDIKFTKAFWDAVEIGVDVYPLLFYLRSGELFYEAILPLKGQ